MLGKWFATDSIPNPVFSYLNKLCAIFITLISGELALQISADCKNLTLQQPCRSWDVRSTLGIIWGQGWGMWGLTYDSIFGLAHHQLFA
jgi:hypothetical protein